MLEQELPGAFKDGAGGFTARRGRAVWEARRTLKGLSLALVNCRRISCGDSHRRVFTPVKVA